MTWRANRELAYLITEFDDMNLLYKKEPLTIKRVVDFFKHGSELIYPAKSYFVAIVYAWLLQKYFKEPFYTALDYEDLLPDDPYFVRYSKDKLTYDQIIKEIPLNKLDKLNSTQKTISYFKQEFLIGTDC